MVERHVLGLSGGKDSAALAVYMRDAYPHLDIDYFFTDTGEELPEVYEFLGRLEGYLGKPITRLNPRRDFRFWLKQYNHFLPSPQTRWCTRQLKLLPFEEWIKPWLTTGDDVTSYVAIRADEDYREGYTSKSSNLHVKLPFREAGIDKPGVMDILESSGLGYPKYYEWRSRSGCTFCFFQQKIEWVRLKERHPEAFEAAKALEKDSLEHGSPFTWSKGESLTQLEQTERMQQIKKEYEIRRERMRRSIPINVLRPVSETPEDIDDIYGEDEGGSACLICHK
ncbi:phosphoadenosine phosphosulfate reductase family protein [Dickeya dianthicola]|uniref:phosphoadenosine phosphosulfate reductase domain-containing protein n=1 Tax=Dickeya dianthicola TaxID=204039 RepID=UPI001F60DCBE|nr:phosphoadenosine phosphosulfate reductase family protein [Dickeya dianthicola]MCI4188376.1 phosphoadenosine phosphosulfate reductase family protein [Dickeya dianthicola]